MENASLRYRGNNGRLQLNMESWLHNLDLQLLGYDHREGYNQVTNKPTFDRREVLEHIRRHYPSCPGKDAQKIAFRIRRKPWTEGTTIGRAVGIMVPNYVRHKMTQYEYLMNSLELTSEEARIVVADDVKDIWQDWQKPKQEVANQ